MKKLKIQMNGRTDEYYTPEIAIYPLLPYLKKDWIILENAWGKGHLANHLQEQGYIVHGDNQSYYDCIVTNPPYSQKEEWLENCYEIGKPFALLLPLTALEGKKRISLYTKYGIELIIPNKRINFITPLGKGGGSWFQTAWFTWKLNLPKTLTFFDMFNIHDKEEV